MLPRALPVSRAAAPLAGRSARVPTPVRPVPQNLLPVRRVPCTMPCVLAVARPLRFPSNRRVPVPCTVLSAITPRAEPALPAVKGRRVLLDRVPSLAMRLVQEAIATLVAIVPLEIVPVPLARTGLTLTILAVLTTSAVTLSEVPVRGEAASATTSATTRIAIVGKAAVVRAVASMTMTTKTKCINIP